MESQCKLPVEILFKILCCLDPLDVVGLRLVSKQFHDITSHPSIWGSLYKKAQLPRPPGPFNSQPTEILENALTRSARVGATWTTEQFRVRDRLINIAGLKIGAPRLICGRWLIGCELCRKFVLYDMNSKTWPPRSQVLYEPGVSVDFWDACSIVSGEELQVFVVFSRWKSDSDIPWKLVELRLDYKTTKFYENISLDVPGVRHPSSRIELVVQKAPFLYIQSQEMVFDTQTRTFHYFPEYSSRVSSFPIPLRPSLVLLLDTHIIAIYYPDDTTLIQAFTPACNPQPATNDPGVLQLTHEVIVDECNVILTPMKQPSVDPANGTTTLRFLHLRDDRFRASNMPLGICCLDLILPKPQPGVVLPITIHGQDLFRVPGGVRDNTKPAGGTYIEYSADGHVRGFCLAHPDKSVLDASYDSNFISRVSVVKFAIDASRDVCQAVVGELSPPIHRYTADLQLPRYEELLFDGIRGRIYYPMRYEKRRKNPGQDGSLFVVDIK